MLSLIMIAWTTAFAAMATLYAISLFWSEHVEKQTQKI